MRRGIGYALIVLVALATLIFLKTKKAPDQAALNIADPEERVVEYLKANVRPGEPVIVTDLYNKVFTTREEHAVLDRLFDAFFRIPLTAAEYSAANNRNPTIEELSDQFHFKISGEMDLMLRILESDPRIPRFLTRDAATGEITQIDVAAIKADPKFGRMVDRTVAGWEGKPAPSFSIESLKGGTLDSASLANQPHLVYFWFSNCPPCVKTAPLLVELYEKYSPQGFKIVAANADHVLQLPYTDADRAEYLQKTGITFSAGHLTTEMQKAYGGVILFPTMVFVDRHGAVVKHLVSFQEKPALMAAIESTLKP